MALFDRNGGLGNLFEGLTPFGTSIPSGILDPMQEEKLKNQALVSGLLGAGATYLATPKNLGAGSPLPYLGKAFLGGMGSSQDTINSALNNAYRQQLLAARDNKDQLYTIDGALVNREGQVIYQAPPEARGKASESGYIQELNRYKESLTNYHQDPQNPLLRNEVKALELKLGLQQPPAAPQTQAEIVKKNLTP